MVSNLTNTGSLAPLERFLQGFGADPSDDEEVRLQKTLLVAMGIAVALFAVVWGLIYFAFDERLASVIPFAYAAISAASLVTFAMTRRHEFFRMSQLLLILILPFFLMVTLGGFVNGSAVILWSLLCPFGALLFAGYRQASLWLVVYVALVIVSAAIDPLLPKDTNLPSAARTVFFVINVIAVSVVAIALLHYFMALRDRALGLLRVEQGRSERLLLNVLPVEVASRLKDDTVDRRSLAEHKDQVSVMFADMVGFTTMSASLTPAKLVDFLDEVFVHFDDLSEKYGVEKIRTIGDAYMVAAGVPSARDDHAQVLAWMALDIMEFASNAVLASGLKTQFRIGINSGPVVAGVIGRQKFQYDLWGHTVNTASRMESQGLPGKIQVTESTRALLADKFVLDPRGEIDVKGIGPVNTYFLSGPA
jgi:adenylate cyclase